MSEVRILLTLGIWVAVLPYLGFPYSLKDILFSVSGIVLICLSYAIYRKFKGGKKEEANFDSFK